MESYYELTAVTYTDEVPVLIYIDEYDDYEPLEVDVLNDILPAIVGSDELPALAAPQSLVELPPPSMELEASIATAPVETKQLSITAPKEIATLQEVLALTAPQTLRALRAPTEEIPILLDETDNALPALLAAAISLPTDIKLPALEQ